MLAAQVPETERHYPIPGPGAFFDESGWQSTCLASKS